jgi:hypothetical protein
MAVIMKKGRLILEVRPDAVPVRPSRKSKVGLPPRGPNCRRLPKVDIDFERPDVINCLVKSGRRRQALPAGDDEIRKPHRRADQPGEPRGQALRPRWDREILSIELGELIDLLPVEGLNISLTGFQIPEIDVLMADMAAPKADPADTLNRLGIVLKRRPDSESLSDMKSPGVLILNRFPT